MKFLNRIQLIFMLILLIACKSYARSTHNPEASYPKEQRKILSKKSYQRSSQLIKKPPHPSQNKTLQAHKKKIRQSKLEIKTKI